MGIIDAAKGAAKILKEAGKIEEYTQILELIDDAREQRSIKRNMVKVNPKHAKNPKEGQRFDMEKIASLSRQIATIRKRHEERINRDR